MRMVVAVEMAFSSLVAQLDEFDQVLLAKVADIAVDIAGRPLENVVVHSLCPKKDDQMLVLLPLLQNDLFG